MKKMIVAFALAVMSAVAMADVGLSYERSYTTDGLKTDVNIVNVNASTAIGAVPGLKATGKLVGMRDEFKNNTMGAEAGLAYDVIPGAYVKGGIGSMMPDSASNYGYYTYGAGLKLKADTVGFLVDAERANAFKAGDPKFTTYKAGASFDVAENCELGANFVRRLGDIDTKGVEFTYVGRFK